MSRPSPVSDSVLVTHPFHPLAGQRLLVILERRRLGAELVLVCEGGPAGRVTVPVGWTDRAPGPLGHRLALDGLAELARWPQPLGIGVLHDRVRHDLVRQ